MYILYKIFIMHFQSELSDFLYDEIYKYGTYHNPATKHYGIDSTGSVACDRCRKDNLSVCIGYKQYDLCMKCVQEIDKQHKNSSFDIAPYGYDSKGRIRTHWCTSFENKYNLFPPISENNYELSLPTQQNKRELFPPSCN